MSTIVIGAGLGGLASAIRLAVAGETVRVLEAGPRPGGKAGITVVDGVECDTGPSVLTMPDVLEDLLAAAGTCLQDELTLLQPDPFFRYRYPGGAVLDVFHDVERTASGIRDTLGPEAADDFTAFLAYARGIWDVAAPPFLYGKFPTLGQILCGLFRIDPLRTMSGAIRGRVRSPELRALFARYATYNGSDPRVAPATLNCIAHLELAGGGYGIAGGVHELVRALVRVAERLGVTFEYGVPVQRVETHDGHVAGVIVAEGLIPCDRIVCNADVAHLALDLLPDHGIRMPAALSMSGWTALFRKPRSEDRAPHEVWFPERYDAEFEDIFDHDRPPVDPTLYLCAQEKAHARTGWEQDEPLFVMANCPPEPPVGGRSYDALRQTVLDRIGSEPLWERSPKGLAAAFPRSRGALYGASSNSRWAAFLRPGNRGPVPGLYLASGSAHPGGGMPLCLLSGTRAAAALLADR